MLAHVKPGDSSKGFPCALNRGGSCLHLFSHAPMAPNLHTSCSNGTQRELVGCEVNTGVAHYLRHCHVGASAALPNPTPFQQS
jgi:hypothetical protein